MRRLLLWTGLGLAALGAAAVAIGVLSPSPARCADPALCRPQQTRLDDHGYLRAVSLDVRGVVPSPEEHAAAEAAGGLDDAMLDEWLASEAFAERVVRRHRELLWPNIENVTTLYHFRKNLARISGSELWYQSATATRVAYRVGQVSCLDTPATFDAEGDIVTTTSADGSVQEGYVMVRPYWDMSTEIKVCAFDAQEARVSARGNDCSTRAAINDPGCGCGPNLRWCATGAVRNEVLRSLAEEMEMRVAEHVRADEPYHDLLTSRRAFVNGPIAYFWRHHRDIHNTVSLVPASVDVEGLPETDIEGGALSFDDVDTWSDIELPEEHSGILTHPVYLLRFQTNRARASRFYDAFLCQPFQPPPGGIPLDDEVAAAQPDVQQRPGCNYCHAILEPAAAHWGRWTQQGGGFLAPTTYPEFRQECADCGRGLEPCSDTCRFHYVTRALSPEEEPYLGTLRAFEFLRDEHRPYVEAGPEALVRQGLADGRFSACSVRRTAEWLLGRSVTDEEEPWIRELTQQFLGSEFRYRDLVRAVVTSETYRRAL